MKAVAPYVEPFSSFNLTRTWADLKMCLAYFAFDHQRRHLVHGLTFSARSFAYTCSANVGGTIELQNLAL